MARIAVMGSGSWGTAFAMVLADAGADVTLWGLDVEVADQINATHVNEVYHPGIVLPPILLRPSIPVKLWWIHRW